MSKRRLPSYTCPTTTPPMAASTVCLDLVHVQAVAGQGGTIQVDHQVVLTRELLGLDVHGALQPHEDRLQLVGEFLQGVLVLAEDPDRHLRPGAGEELVQVVGDGLGQVQGDPRQVLQLMTDLILNLLQVPSGARPNVSGPSGS